ncbi:MAG TPA: RDD family protein [Rariglobus sp.]
MKGQRLGPVSQAEFEQLASAGTITADTLVWRDGMADWRPYAEAVPAAEGRPPEDDSAVCAVSGRRYPKREMVEYQGQWVSAEHRDEFFQRIREGVTQPGQLDYASFGRRFVAKLIDGIILFVVGMVNNAVCAFLLLGTFNYFRPDVHGPEAVGRMLIFNFLTFVIGQAIGIGYALYFIRRFDATPGKLALGLRLVRADGSSLTKGRIVGRHFAEIINAFTLCIGYLMAAFDEERRALHDRICDTRVIRNKR